MQGQGLSSGENLEGVFDSTYDKIVTLGILQKDLRQAVRDSMPGEEDNIPAHSRRFGLSWKQASSFLSGIPACSGVVLQKLTEGINRQALGHEIAEVSRTLNCRERGLSVYDVDVIRMVFAIRHAFFKVQERLSLKQFSHLFQPYSKEVKGTVLLIKVGLEGLASEKVREWISEILKSTDWNRVDVVLPQKNPSHVEVEVREKIQEVHNTLKMSYKNIAGLLGLHEDTLSRFMKNESTRCDPAKMMRKLKAIQAKTVDDDTVRIKKSKRLSELVHALQHQPGQESVSKEVVSQRLGLSIKTLNKMLRADAEVKISIDSVILKAEKMIGAQSSAPLQEQNLNTEPVLVVRNILSRQTFSEHEHELGERYISFTQKTLETVRFLLNEASQHKNPKVRERIRKALGREVEETKLSIDAFTKEFPNRLLELLDTQRDDWLGPLKTNLKR